MFLEVAYIVPHPPIILPEVGRGEEMKIQKQPMHILKLQKNITNRT